MSDSEQQVRLKFGIGSGEQLSAQPGARFAPEHLERPMKVYPVHASEIETLSFLNPVVSACFSAGSSILLLGIGFLVDIAIEGQFTNGLTAYGKAITFVLVPVLGILGLMSLAAGVYFTKRRDSVWERIKRESHPIQ